MVPRKAVLPLIGAASGVAAGAFYLTGIGAQEPQPLSGPQGLAGEVDFGPTELTQEQQAALDKRDEYLKSIGAWQPPAKSTDSLVLEARGFEETVHVSKEEIRLALQGEMAANKQYFEDLAGVVGRERAARLEEEYWAPRIAEVNAVPASGKDVVLSMAEEGAHSIVLETVTRSSPGGNVSDPVNITYWGNGDVGVAEYNLRNLTAFGWENDDGQFCGRVDQYVYIDDTSHGGYAYWASSARDVTYPGESLQTRRDQCGSGDRYHTRIFDARYKDSHGDAGQWSVANAHYEHVCGLRHCVDSWQLGENEVDRAHRSGGSLTGAPLYFVERIHHQFRNNAGWYGDVYNDDQALWIKLR